jgi:hypothetical protein
MFSGRTMASKSSAGMPSAMASSRKSRPVLVRGLGDLGGAVVAVLFLQWRDEHQRVAQTGFDVLVAWLDADNAIVGERNGGVGQQPHRLKEVVGHHRIVDVEFEVALAAGEGDRCVVAMNVGCNLGQCLALRRVDLARHDR